MEAPPHDVLVRRLPGERLEGVRAHVLRWRVDDRTEVAEGELVEPRARVVGVERPPAAVLGLHAGDPGQSALHRILPELELAEREADDRRVVDVRVEVVLELEGPAAGGEAGSPHGPVAGDGHLLAEQPLAGPRELRVIGGHVAGAKREDCEGRVPYGRLARLGSQPVSLLDEEAAPALDGSAEARVVEVPPERGEHEDRPDPRWLDAAPAAVGLLPIAHPLLGGGDRAAAERRRIRGRGRRAVLSSDLR